MALTPGNSGRFMLLSLMVSLSQTKPKCWIISGDTLRLAAPMMTICVFGRLEEHILKPQSALKSLPERDLPDVVQPPCVGAQPATCHCLPQIHLCS